MTEPEFKSGHVSIVGRPNVGKSTLLNALMDRKVSIVTPKPQTTRQRILGILTRVGFQVAFVDTPGLHQKARKAINRAMNRAAAGSLVGADLVLLVVEALRWTHEDDAALQRVQESRARIVLVVNKVDKVAPKTKLLPYIETVSTRAAFAEIVPVSAQQGTNLDRLMQVIVEHLPAGPQLYPDEYTTDQSEPFRAAEIIREKLMLRLEQEVPYGVAVEIERYEQPRGRRLISAVIWVERPAHKAIVIGRRGELLKQIGRAARLDLERITGDSVHLELWVKVKPHWSNDEQALRHLGY